MRAEKPTELKKISDILTQQKKDRANIYCQQTNTEKINNNFWIPETNNQKKVK